MKLEKGMIISVDDWWYVVVNFSDKHVDCICDNANNIYRWPTSDIHSYMTLQEIGKLGWEYPDREMVEPLSDRKIPYDVILEVLTGRHDNRFNHWDEDKP